MKIFVSYSRADNSIERLVHISRSLSWMGHVYVDDLHYDASVDRSALVLDRLNEADTFVAVLTQRYLRTAWTIREVECAQRMDLKLFTLEMTGELRRNSYSSILLPAAIGP